MIDPNVAIGVSELSPRAVQRAAEANFKKGYYCCESLVYTMKQMLELDVPDSVVAMASGMSVGAGKSGCACGAFNGCTIGFARTTVSMPSAAVS